jgi:hypothetical protein
MNERMRDAAFANTIGGSWTGAVAGYYGGPDAFHVWAPHEWTQFHRNRKLPIWVAGQDGPGEGRTAIHALRALGVPPHVYTVVDMEGRVDKAYVEQFGAAVQAAGYKVWVYGQASTVFENPGLNGYWVAEYAGKGPFMFGHAHVRATQYATSPQYDSSTVRDWTYDFGTWWV